MIEKLSIEEVKQLENNELGKRLAELAGIPITDVSGLDWLENFNASASILCTSTDAVSGIEDVVIEKGLKSEYGKFLTELSTVFPPNSESSEWVADLVMTKARICAEALFLALQNLENQK